VRDWCRTRGEGTGRRAGLWLHKALTPSQPVAPVAVKHEVVTVRRPAMPLPYGPHKRERAPPPRRGKPDQTVELRSCYLIFTAQNDAGARPAGVPGAVPG